MKLNCRPMAALGLRSPTGRPRGGSIGLAVAGLLTLMTSLAH